MNYNKLMEEEIEKILIKKETPSLLLHSCCAPCSSHVIDRLTPFFNITILYYNPNIEPLEEYEKRKQEEIRFISEYPNKNNLNMIDCDHDNILFHQSSKGLEAEPEGGARCIKCYHLRMEKTASIAKENGYDYFATTLTVSPLKNSKKLNEIGEYLSKKYNIKYLYSDFKKKEGYKHSIEMSKEYNLYRQDYCGCIYSKEARELEKNNANN
ncbi:MAG: epoxyqueuosine reductase QueH [Bacilli bacterium]|nr:epoxyqueuosine reductase QueH [Bacilli bacterium]